MRISITCDDMVGALSRALDLSRRMGIEIALVTACQGGSRASLEISVNAPAGSALSILGERITLIEGVRSVSFGEAGAPVRPDRLVTGRDVPREG